MYVVFCFRFSKAVLSSFLIVKTIVSEDGKNAACLVKASGDDCRGLSTEIIKVLK